MSANSTSQGIRHVFVLMLENRAFDHMLGFSAITGTDAATGQPTQINGLTGAESNTFNGQTHVVSQPAGFTMPVDPLHEFPDILLQLCGPAAKYAPGGAYPPIDGSGFVASYVASNGTDPAEIMKCYSPSQLPVLTALAKEFAVCDNWCGSLPGPTWPNRLFVHGASSGGLDHSPTTAEIVLWETLAGFSLKHGTIFDAMNKKKLSWRICAGDEFPMTAALKGIHLSDVQPYQQFLHDVAQASYSAAYTFIEPSYNVLADYKCSTSQHPLDDVTRGESLIKCTYEAIRSSPLWSQSMLIVTWDEHGGFYDHAIPPAAAAPGDTLPGSAHNKFGFTFQQYGPRVPAVVVSPLIPRNLVDHRLYDHASIPATLEALFGLKPMTARDAAANSLTALASLPNPRTDAPATLPDPAPSGVGGCPPFLCSAQPVAALAMAASEPPPVSRPAGTVNDGNVPGVLQAALRSDLALSPAADRKKIIARVGAITTRREAKEYVEHVRRKVRARRA
ncbi:MAG: phosphoesterase [Acidobacteriia bacterium]|nr:phosphoesterase [Terriglobia bacterium]